MGSFLGEILSSKREQNSWMTSAQKLSQCASARLWGRGSCVWAGGKLLAGEPGLLSNKAAPGCGETPVQGEFPDLWFLHSAVLPSLQGSPGFLSSCSGLEQAVAVQKSLLRCRQGRWSALIPSRSTSFMQHFWQNPVCFISWCALDECLCCWLKFLTGLTDSQEQLLKGLFVAAVALLWPGDSGDTTTATRGWRPLVGDKPNCFRTGLVPVPSEPGQRGQHQWLSWAWVVLPWRSWETGLPLLVLLAIHLLCTLLLATAWSPT